MHKLVIFISIVVSGQNKEVRKRHSPFHSLIWMLFAELDMVYSNLISIRRNFGVLYVARVVQLLSHNNIYIMFDKL